jgi:molecular chaperone GrpE|tara:strand:- start:781 stop:1320 length:540 start_codon:yes stop_codon:yes gene_type:complete
VSDTEDEVHSEPEPESDEMTDDNIIEENEIIDPIAVLEEQIAELEKELQYRAAEISNVRQRGARDRSEILKFRSVKLATNILPVLDGLEKALNSSNSDSESLIEGVRMTLNALKSTLESEGVVKVEAKGKIFNPSTMEAIATIPAPKGTELGTVIEVIEEGYTLHERVLRPAKVIVSGN